MKRLLTKNYTLYKLFNALANRITQCRTHLHKFMRRNLYVAAA